MRGDFKVAIRRCIIGLALAVVVLAGAAPALTSSNGVVISEFRFRGPAGGNDEFVELMNTSSGPVAIGGWEPQGCASGTRAPAARVTGPAGGTLQAGGHHPLFQKHATRGGVGGGGGGARAR